MNEPTPAYKVAANAIADATNADILLVNSPIARPLDLTVLKMCRQRQRRENVLVILVTEGGDPDPAYRLARCLQDNYRRFSLFVSGYCKSAGTLVALGANELIIADSGELGPLDVQMSKPDELAQMQSGLTATSALATLHNQAFQAFENFFLQLVAKSGNTISTRTATQLAAQLVCGLFAPLYGHMDPMHVGEAGRALLIAQKYGQLLQNKANNLKPKSLIELTTEYPSHGFVIDRLEAERLFQCVREPNASEHALIDSLQGAVIEPINVYDQQLVAYLSDELPRSQVLSGLGGSNENAQPHESATAASDAPEPEPSAAEEPGTPQPNRGAERRPEREIGAVRNIREARPTGTSSD
jgi:hypothetical protein